MVVYRCEDSIESIFTAVYLAYEEKRNHEDTLLRLDDEPRLFAEDVWVIPQQEKVFKVMRTLRNQFGEDNYYQLCMALASYDPSKAQAVYRTIVLGLRHRVREGHLFDNLADDDVNKAFKLARNASREHHHLLGFLRFQELENGILYSRVGPKNNVLTFLMPHFADRFPIENFMVYDEVRNFFGVHPAGKQWYLIMGEEANLPPRVVLSEKEQEYQALFQHFCRSIAIKERENRELQRNMLPLRFREYMIEFRT